MAPSDNVSTESTDGSFHANLESEFAVLENLSAREFGPVTKLEVTGPDSVVASD
jgi:hypothetical protein